MKKRVMFALSLLVIVVFNASILTNPHLARLSLISIKETTKIKYIYQKPHIQGDAFVYDVDNKMPLLPCDLRPSNDVNRVDSNIAYLVHDFGSILEKAEKTSNLIPESVLKIQDEIYKHLTRGSCYIDARLFVSKMQRSGYYARLVAFVSDDGLGRKGHTIAEVWEPVRERWVMVDPQQAAVFFNRSGELLSVIEVRRLLLSGCAEDSILVKQGPGFEVAHADIWAFYRETINDIHYDTKNNLYTIATSWEGEVYGVVEASSKVFGRKMIYFGRLIRSLLIPQERIRVMDNFSGPSYNPNLWYYSFRIVNAVGFIFVLTIMLFVMKGKMRG